MTTLHAIDWLLILGYFAVVFGIAWWAYLKEKQSETSTEYFLAGRNLGWWVIGASIFASNIGSEHLVGLAGSGATDGVAMAHYELHAWCLLVLAGCWCPSTCAPGVHDAGVSRAAISIRPAAGSSPYFAGRLRRDQNRGGDFRRRDRLRRADCRTCTVMGLWTVSGSAPSW